MTNKTHCHLCYFNNILGNIAQNNIRLPWIISSASDELKPGAKRVRLLMDFTYISNNKTAGKDIRYNIPGHFSFATLYTQGVNSHVHAPIRPKCS